MTNESPLEIESREELVYLLGEACEIEHGLMCEYIYAQFSLKRAVDEGVTPEQLTHITAWNLTLVDIIKQEMLHLALATNILTSVGAGPHFERPNFPILARWYPPGVQVALLPFGERALRHFVYLERPEGMTLNDAEGFGALPDEAGSSFTNLRRSATQEPWQTVGHLYRGIEAGLTYLCHRYGEDDVFIGPPGAQAVTEIFEWSELTAVTDLPSARRAIELIVEQGEGTQGDWVNAHFGKFVGMLEDFLLLKTVDIAFNPTRPVDPAYVKLPPDVESGILIEDPLTVRVAELCGGLYEVILQVLSRYYMHQGESPAELDTLARTAKHLMNWAFRTVGSTLTTLPIGPSFPGRTAGPTLEIVRPAFFVLPHHDSAWKVISERIEVLTDECSSLAREPILDDLRGLPEKLESISGDLRTHLKEHFTT
jgi:Ferritin-like